MGCVGREGGREDGGELTSLPFSSFTSPFSRSSIFVSPFSLLLQDEWASTKAKGGDEVRRRLGRRKGRKEGGGGEVSYKRIAFTPSFVLAWLILMGKSTQQRAHSPP